MTPLAEVNTDVSHTDSETGMRHYSWEGEQYISVTSLRRAAGLSFNLHQWAITQVVNRAVDELDALNRMVTQDDEKVKALAKTWLRRAAIEERDRKADLGKRIHAAAAMGKGLGEVEQDVVDPLRQYKAWLQQEQPKVLGAELTVWNLSRGYAGTLDLLAQLKDGRIALVDLKSGTSTWLDHALQLCGYALCEFASRGGKRDDTLTEVLLNVNTLAILHLQKTQWKFEEIEVTRDMMAAFNGLLAFAKWTYGHPKMSMVLRETIIGKAPPI